MEYLVDMVHRIKVNGFSITYEEDFERIGIGLYGIPSFMNHSCRPNALQTFLLRSGTPPSLCVTAFRDILSQQEICISYTDTSCPSHVRMKRLEEDYLFTCTCEACDNNSDLQDDSKTMAIRCLDCDNQSSLSSCSSVIRTHSGMAPGCRHVYQCTKCSKTDFEPTLQQLEKFEKETLNCRTVMENQPKKLNKTYQNLKSICHMESWYVQEAGDRMLQYYIDKLPMQKDDPAQEQHTAWAALKIAEELMGNELPSMSSGSAVSTTRTNDFISTSVFLRHQQLRYKAGKLRLFLIPDPRQSVQELQQVLISLKLYFSEDHAVILGLRACLANARM